MRSAFACVAAAAALLTAGAASAQSAPEVAWNIGAVSDYVFRGYTQSNENPAIQGGVDANFGSFYVGAWASSVDFGDDTDTEVDIYGGYRGEAGGFAFDVGAVGYGYAGEPDGADYDYVELKAAASRAVGPATFGGAFYWSPDFFGLDKEAAYLEGNVAFTPADKWTVTGAVGYQWLNVNDNYTSWNLGVGYALTEHVAIDVRYHDADVDGPLSDARAVAGIKFLF